MNKIKQLELKMLTNRDREESPKAALTRTEQLEYANYLDSTGHHQSAAFFRLEGDFGLNSQKKKASKAAISNLPDGIINAIKEILKP